MDLLCYKIPSQRRNWIIQQELQHPTQRKKVTIQQVTIMLATSMNILFPGHNHLLTTSTDDPSLAGARAIIKVLGHQYRWVTGGYDLEIGHF